MCGMYICSDLEKKHVSFMCFIYCSIYFNSSAHLYIQLFVCVCLGSVAYQFSKFICGFIICFSFLVLCFYFSLELVYLHVIHMKSNLCILYEAFSLFIPSELKKIRDLQCSMKPMNFLYSRTICYQLSWNHSQFSIRSFFKGDVIVLSSTLINISMWSMFTVLNVLNCYSQFLLVLDNESYRSIEDY